MSARRAFMMQRARVAAGRLTAERREFPGGMVRIIVPFAGRGNGTCWA